MPSSFSREANSTFRESAVLTAMPSWQTNKSTNRPGVVTVLTWSTIVGYLFRYRGAVITVIFAPSAVSPWPPAPLMTRPLESVMTLTLKSVSISVAPKITKSNRLKCNNVRNFRIIRRNFR